MPPTTPNSARTSMPAINHLCLIHASRVQSVVRELDGKPGQKFQANSVSAQTIAETRGKTHGGGLPCVFPLISYLPSLSLKARKNRVRQAMKSTAAHDFCGSSLTFGGWPCPDANSLQ